MHEPLVVPGHPVDNPPTDDYWPHLDADLDPVFSADDGTVAGPVQALDAKWFVMTDGPGATESEPMITDPLIAVTDSRVVVLGRVGDGGPPDRRLITQFQLVNCRAVEWDLTGGRGPQVLILGGMLMRGQAPAQVSLVLRFPQSVDVRSLAQELLNRAARRYLALDLVDPDAHVSVGESEKDYVAELARVTLEPAERQASVPFPRFRVIRHGDDFRAGGPDVRATMVHAEFA